MRTHIGSRDFHFLLFILGLFTIICGLLCRFEIMQMISARPFDEFNFSGPRTTLILSGSAITALALIGLKWNWIPTWFLNHRTRNRILQFAAVTAILFFNLEMVLRTLFVHDMEQLAKRSIQYQPTALGNFVIDDREQDVMGYSINDPKVRLKLRGGYRGEDIESPKSQNEIRIVIFGGSHVFDPFAPLGESWPQQTEKLLHDQGLQNVRVINAGVPGYRTFDAIGSLLGELHFFEPDYFVLCNSYNDLKYFPWISREKTPLRNLPASDPNQSWNMYGRQGGFFQNTFGNLRIGMALKKWWWFDREGKQQADDLDFVKSGQPTASSNCEDAHRQYAVNVETIITVCRSLDIRPILFTEGSLVTYQSIDLVKSRNEKQSTGLSLEGIAEELGHCDFILKSLASKHKVPFFDLAEKVEGRPGYFSDIIHFSNEGRKMAAIQTANYFHSLLQANHDTIANVQ